MTLAAVFALALLAPGDHDLTLTHAGRERTYVVQVPPRAGERGPLPVILAFHGGGGNASGFKKYAGLDTIADREGLVVVYPDGTGPLARKLLTWNAGACCGYAQSHDVDDVGFALAILAALTQEMPLDATRVFATGHSNGAMMAYRLAIEASVEPGLRRWAAFDGCPAEARVTEQREGSRRREESHTATLLVWAPCAPGVEVAFWRLTGAGHGWPGGKSPLPVEIMWTNTSVIRAAEEIWKFLRRFSR
ncbi:MAG: alpha/beta hydrolase family esterase [Candidatus Rokuibacteriota bacterium]